MLRTGLVSVTFRPLPPRKIVDLVAEAGLEGIEWGGDVHVPHGDLATAREVAGMTYDRGIAVAAFGSYYRAASLNGPGFDDVLATAQILGAPTIRVWAGEKSSQDADEAYREQVANDLHRIAKISAAEGITVSLEYHGGTLTDGQESALRLVATVDHPNLRLYWQPEVTRSAQVCAAELARLRPLVSNIHVFQWSRLGSETVRHPLTDGASVWPGYLAAAMDCDFALLEFVRDGSVDQFLADARTLRKWMGH